ncbi:hypothetical protein J2W96_007687 [Variovorax guangxiensis]|nr:hypothetical protein [Variovorax guangxiensis]
MYYSTPDVNKEVGALPAQDFFERCLAMRVKVIIALRSRQ